MTKFLQILKIIASYTVGIIITILLATISIFLAPIFYVWCRKLATELTAAWEEKALKDPQQITVINQ